MTWKDVLDSWERKIALTEQALEKNASWEDVIAEETTVDDSLGAPPRELYARYEMLSQRTTALDKRITEKGEEILAEIAQITEARASRRNPNLFSRERYSAVFDAHA